jgi:hypothetical protein
MFVDRKKIRFDAIGSGVTINIPIKLEFTPTDNSELIQEKFVNDELFKAINPIDDYKKVRFKPAKVNTEGVWEVVDEFKLGINMFTRDSIVAGNPQYSTNSDTTPYSSYDDLFPVDNPINSDDLFCQTNRLMKSFLTLNFYTTSDIDDAIFIGFTNIFTQIGNDQRIETGQSKQVDKAPISYRIGDPIFKPELVHEGFHLYWYKDLVDNGDNQEYHMYMSAEFNNAANGQTSLLYPLQTPQISINDLQLSDINGVNGGLFLKCILKNVNGNYYYTFDPKPIQTGVDWNTAANVPNITFYQVSPAPL